MNGQITNLNKQLKIERIGLAGLIGTGYWHGKNALKLFHFPEADEMARQAGRSASSGRGAFGDIQRKNAEDFSKYFGEGFAESTGGGNPTINVSDMHVVAAKVMIQEALNKGFWR